MKLRLYEPRKRQREDEQVTITKARAFVFNVPATARLKGRKYVRLRYNTKGRIAVEASAERRDNSLRIHFSKGEKVCSISAAGLLRLLRYKRTEPRRRFDLSWSEREQRFEFKIGRELLTGRTRRRRKLRQRGVKDLGTPASPQ